MVSISIFWHVAGPVITECWLSGPTRPLPYKRESVFPMSIESRVRE